MGGYCAIEPLESLALNLLIISVLVHTAVSMTASSNPSYAPACLVIVQCYYNFSTLL